MRPARLPRTPVSVRVVMGDSSRELGFRLTIENMVHTSTAHEVLTVVFRVGGLDRRRPRLNVLLWQRAREPQLGRWSLPGGLRSEERRGRGRAEGGGGRVGV